VNESAPKWRAPLWKRATARLIDTCAMAVIEFVMFIVTVIISLLVTSAFLRREALEDLYIFFVLWLILMVPASIPAYLYEVGTTARSGQTWGKGLAEIRVVRWNGEAPVIGEEGSVERRRCRLRFAIPHAAGVVTAVVAVLVVLPGTQDAGPGDFWGTAAGGAAVPWALVYASSLFDRNRRGWHDKAAGTIVVRATDDVIERLQERAAKGWRPHPQARPDQSKHAKPWPRSLPPPG